MEDYSYIFWILLTVGALVFSAVSKTHKAAKEGDNPQQSTSDSPFPWPFPLPTDESQHDEVETKTYNDPYSREEYADELYPEEAQSLEQIPNSERTHMQASNTTAKQDQFNTPTRSTLEDTFQHSTYKAAGGSLIGRAQEDALRNAEPTTEEQANSQRELDEVYANVCGDEVIEAEIGTHTTHRETFDLRSAVIASEILKPKFED